MTITAAKKADTELKWRLLTALTLAPWLPLAIWFDQDFLLMALLLPVLWLAAREWLTLSGCGQTERIACLAGLILLSLPMAIWPNAPAMAWFLDALIALGVLWWLAVPTLLWRGIWPKRPAPKAAMLFPTLLPAYAAFAFLTLPDSRESAILAIHLLLLTWVADSAAWLSGKLWGRRKLAPSISPGKTWEGVAGALAAVCALGVLTGWWLGWGAVAVAVLLLCGAVTLAGGVYGDLLESRLKRGAGAKDSGSLLPGHGGVLDRVDSVTAAAPVFAACARLGLLG